MEWIIRTGADKKKQKIIEELNKELKEIKEELRLTKIERDQYKTERDISKNSLRYYKSRYKKNKE